MLGVGKILIVDDERLIQQLLSRLLEGEGHSCTAVGSIDEARTQLDSQEFDLILSRPMIRCLWRARKVGRRLFPENAKRWVFPGSSNGHSNG